MTTQVLEAKKEFQELIESILADGNTVTFAINDPENKGVVINEWTVLEEEGSAVPESWISSQVVDIEEEVAWDIMRGLGFPYPIIHDESTGEQVQ